MSLFSRKETPESPAATPQRPVPAPLRSALASLGAAQTLTAPELDAWLEKQDSLLALELFGSAAEPAACLLGPVALFRAAGGDALIAGFHRSLGPALCPGAATWYLPRLLPAGSAAALRLEYGDWLPIGIRTEAGTVALFCPAASLRPAAAPAADEAAPVMRVDIRDPGSFHLARLFLPLTWRKSGMTIRSRVRSLHWQAPGSSGEAAAPETVLYALRWTLGGEPLVFWLRCPARIPPAMIHALALEGTLNFGRLAGSGGLVPELAGPVAAKGLDPRMGFCVLTYEVTIHQQSAAWQVLLPAPLGGRLQKLFGDPGDLEWLAGAPDAAGNAASGFAALMSILAGNRHMAERGQALALALPQNIGEEDIACAVYDRVDALPERDLVILVQNYLVPRGTDAVLDCFFPRGGFDPLVWRRVSKVLGEKPTLSLAQALKEGRNKTAGLDAASLGELVQAARAGRLELGPRGQHLLVTVLGGMVDGSARRQLEPIMAAGLPGVLLARLAPDQRMKALTEMVDRERLIAFLGQRDHVLTLMEGFSKNGKQRALEDFDVLAKAWERGDIPTTLVTASKNEAVCFISRHLALQVMNAWPASEWKRYQDSLGAEELLFFVFDEGSCFHDTPLHAKLAAGLGKEFVQGLEAQLAAQKKEKGWQARLPAFMHQALAEKLLAGLAEDEGDVLPAAKPRPRR